MLSIDRLRIHLPEDYRNRATPIARMVAEALAEQPVSGSLDLERLTVPAVPILPGASDRQIAHSIAAAIHGCLNPEKG